VRVRQRGLPRNGGLGEGAATRRRPYGRFRTLTEMMTAARTTPEVAALVTSAAEKMAAALVSVLNVVDVDEVVLAENTR